MSSLVSINFKPDARELRKFGLTMIIGFALIGGILFWREAHVLAYFAWTFGGVTGLLALTGTAAGLPLYWLWMGIAFVMGSIIGPIVLAICYYGVVTPIALIMRLGGRDALLLRKLDTDSYWVDIDAPSDVESYERQF